MYTYAGVVSIYTQRRFKKFCDSSNVRVINITSIAIISAVEKPRNQERKHIQLKPIENICRFHGIANLNVRLKYHFFCFFLFLTSNGKCF